MEPILTLPYSEWLVAQQLMLALPTREGFSVYAPLSRQEKGVDLLITKREKGMNRVATLQVKYSRAYETPPKSKFRFAIWFRGFRVPEEADFVILAALYPNITGKGGGTQASWWLPLLLVFTREEMSGVISSLRTRSGKPDKMFYFGFDSPEQVVQTRGAPEDRDCTDFTFANRLPMLRAVLEGDTKTRM
jgi:hypothetical protein